MKTIVPTLLLMLCSITIANAQQKEKLNAASIELGKNGLIYNLNFDHKIKAQHFGYRFTLGNNFAKYLNAISFGGGSYYLIGNKKHFLELGLDLQYLIVNEVSDDQIGFTILYPNYSIKTFVTSFNLGYRTYGKKTLFRAGISPSVIDSRIILGGYISFGLVL